MYERPFAYTRRFEATDVASMADRVRELLPSEGFGVLTEIDVKATLKKKLDVDRKPYLILGACNPTIAHQALEAEPAIGVFLPCNVDVFEGEDGAVYVQTVDPERVFGILENPAVAPMAREIGERLQRVLDKL